MWPNPLEIADLVTFTEEILNGKLHFCGVLLRKVANILSERDLIYFTTRVLNTSDMIATRVRHEGNKTATRTTRVRQKWKILILITTRVKIFFHTTMLTIWQMKDHKERNSFIPRTIFWRCLLSIPKYIWEVHYKNWTL